METGIQEASALGSHTGGSQNRCRELFITRSRQSGDREMPGAWLTMSGTGEVSGEKSALAFLLIRTQIPS